MNRFDIFMKIVSSQKEDVLHVVHCWFKNENKKSHSVKKKPQKNSKKNNLKREKKPKEKEKKKKKS